MLCFHRGSGAPSCLSGNHIILEVVEPYHLGSVLSLLVNILNYFNIQMYGNITVPVEKSGKR